VAARCNFGSEARFVRRTVVSFPGKGSRAEHTEPPRRGEEKKKSLPQRRKDAKKSRKELKRGGKVG
jgi:hypothetical protein